MRKGTEVSKFASLVLLVEPKAFWMTFLALIYIASIILANFCDVFIVTFISMLTESKLVVQTDRNISHCEVVISEISNFFRRILVVTCLLAVRV